ncbi:MAG: DUF3152 domain-containing protein [Propionibacterium sp.]|nr:DUF3152 domain-containing protein [Propionibacterium sp.]
MAWRIWTGLIVATVVLTACGSGGDTSAIEPAPSPSPAVASVEPTDSPQADSEVIDTEPIDSEVGSLTAIGPRPATIDDDGMKHSGIIGDGEFVTNTIEHESVMEQSDVRKYVVQVESGVDVDVDETAREIHQILDSERGWAGYHGVGFHLVNDPSTADLILKLASPPTVDEGCVSLNTMGTWNCRVGSQVFINSDRWWYGTPTWQNYLLSDYRAYLINHEVGHYLGFGHLTCPEPGALSPVMQQQSIYLNECLPNPWPDVTGERDG